QPFGPFINRNNAGGFLEIGLAAAVGLLLWRLLTIPQIAVPRPPARRGAPKERETVRRILWLLANLNGSMLSAGASVLVISAAVLTSFSRGSFIAMMVGTLFALMLMVLVSRRSVYGWVVAATVASGLGLTAWLGQ